MRRAGRVVALGLLAATAGLLVMGLAISLGPLGRGPVLSLAVVGALLLAVLAASLVRS